MAAPARLRRSAAITLGSILLLAAGLRLLGLSYGLPAVYNPDEVAITARALAFAKGDLNPHNFLYPTFYFYVLFAWIGAAFTALWATGSVSSLAAFQTLFFVDPTSIYLAGRWLGVVCGVAGVAATFTLSRRAAAQIGWQAHATEVGLIAALFLAVAPGHVRDSHYIKHDVPVTLAIALAQIAILRLLATPRPAATRDWPLLVAAAACGVAFSTHYYAVFLAVPLALAILWRQTGAAPHRVVTSLTLAAAVTTVVFFALSPFLLVEPLTAWQDIVANRQIVVDRAVEARHGLFASAGAYLRMIREDALGTLVAIAAFLGLCLLPLRRDMRRHWRTAIVLIAFPALFLAFISNTVAASRYLNPVLPTLCFLAALGISAASRLLLGARPRPASPSTATSPAAATVAVATFAVATFAVALLALLAAAPSGITSLRLGLFFRQDDTRTQAQRYIEREIPAGATVLVQPYSVPIAQSRDSLREALTRHLGDPARASTKFALRLAAEPYPSPAYRTLFLGDGGLDPDKIYLSYGDLVPDRAADTLADAGVQFLVLKQYNVPDPAVAPLRTWLAGHARLLAAFSPYQPETSTDDRRRIAPFLHNTDTPYDPALQRPGPGVEVWRID